MSEKALARRLDVQFTPTLLFFDEKGKVVARLNGYYPPHRFEAVLDYVAGRHERKHVARRLSRAARAGRRRVRGSPTSPSSCRRRTIFAGVPAASRSPCCSRRPIAVRATSCIAEGFKRPQVRALLNGFDVARFAFGAPTRLTTPAGHATTASAWANELGVTFTPTLVFFAADGREVFRIDAYLRPFHLESSLDYVASGAYRDEPSFQRYIQGARGTDPRARARRSTCGSSASGAR